MVTPISLNGAGCALAVPAVSTEDNKRATNMCVFTDASLPSRVIVGTDRSVGEDGQRARLNQPLAVALDESVFGAAHRRRRHLAVLVTTHGLPVRLVQRLARLRE